MVNLCLEVNTSRRISPQILRHSSFSFQEFSQRYAAVTEYVDVWPRRQDTKNRQSSHDDLPEETIKWFLDAKEEIQLIITKRYNEALDKGIAKESAAFFLPGFAKTTLYINGNIRSWVHYINLRTLESTQYEHRIIAYKAKQILLPAIKNISEGLGWED
jgi:thymidylate synthase (FAD)